MEEIIDVCDELISDDLKVRLVKRLRMELGQPDQDEEDDCFYFEAKRMLIE